MKVTVKLFAAVRDIVGDSELELRLSEGADARQIWDRLVANHPGLAIHHMPMVAINEEYAEPETGLRDGDELAFIPPVSGG